MTAPHVLLTLLDCPVCRAGAGVVPQSADDKLYLACAKCEFWYPVRDEVPLLLPPDRNPFGLYRPLQAPAEFPLERRPTRSVDLKALIYSYYVRMHEFGTAFHVEREPLVVDIGCSTGSLACWLQPEQVYVGFDASFDSLAFARRATGQFFVQADAECLPVKSDSVPFFTSREVLEHLNDPRAGVRELGRIGRRGVIVVPTLDFPIFYDPVNWLLIRRGRRAKFGVYGYGHQRLYDVAGWRALIEQSGCAITSERGIGSGLLLNASDVLWHSLYSWREFDNLPRHGASLAQVQTAARLWRTLHRIDRPLLAEPTLSRAFEVVPRAAAG